MEKYVVFKVEDYLEFLQMIARRHAKDKPWFPVKDEVDRYGNLIPDIDMKWAMETAPSLGHAVPDAVVIRKQDMFSSVAFYAYASAVLAAKAMLRKQAGGYSHREMDRLEELRMYFIGEAQAAAASANTGRSKVPD